MFFNYTLFDCVSVCCVDHLLVSVSHAGQTVWGGKEGGVARGYIEPKYILQHLLCSGRAGRRKKTYCMYKQTVKQTALTENEQMLTCRSDSRM